MLDLKLIAKGGLVILIIVSLAILIERLTWTGRPWEDDFRDIIDEKLKLNYTFWPSNDTDASIYNNTFARCLRHHSESIYYPIIQDQNISFTCIGPGGRCLHYFLIRTAKVLESLNIRIILIEPSLLFCLLPSSRQYNLLTRGYSPIEFRGSKNVVTFGINYAEAKILDEIKTRKRLASFGYRIMRFDEKKRIQVMDENYLEAPAPHYFIIHHDVVMHLTVFYPKHAYLSSFSLNTLEINVHGLQFVNNRILENFNTSVAYFDTSSTAPVLLPSDPRCFLLDMMSSQYSKCGGGLFDIPGEHPETVIVLKELKTVLASQMVTFWLWSKSLQGWYEKCDIHHYSKELQFSVSAKSVQGYNFTSLFINSFCQHIETHFGTKNISRIELICYDINVHLIFMYEEKITYWTEYVDGENIYRLSFPKFTLCSTDVYGEKINVPCETDELLKSEYGQFLKNTTLNLDEKSMKNVMLLTERV